VNDVEVIHPERLYDARTAAELLGIHRDTLYRIPDRLLPRSRVGPRRGRTKFRGRALIEYLDRMER
jgi:hypothetical protein